MVEAGRSSDKQRCRRYLVGHAEIGPARGLQRKPWHLLPATACRYWRGSSSSSFHGGNLTGLHKQRSIFLFARKDLPTPRIIHVHGERARGSRRRRRYGRGGAGAPRLFLLP